MIPLIYTFGARGEAEARNINSIPEAIDYAMDDRSHGDEYFATAAGEIAREKWGAVSGPAVPTGDREAAVAFLAEAFARATAMMAVDKN